MCQTIIDPSRDDLLIDTPRAFADYLRVAPQDLVFNPPDDWMGDARSIGWEDMCLCHCNIPASAKRYGYQVQLNHEGDDMRFVIVRQP